MSNRDKLELFFEMLAASSIAALMMYFLFDVQYEDVFFYSGSFMAGATFTIAKIKHSL